MELHAIWLAGVKQWSFMALPPLTRVTRVTSLYCGRPCWVTSLESHRWADVRVGKLETWEVAQLFGGG